MGVCTSTKKYKEVKVKEKGDNQPKSEEKKKTELNAIQEVQNETSSNRVNEANKNEEKKGDEIIQNRNSSDFSESDDNPDNQKKNKSKKKMNDINNNSKIIVNYCSNGKTEFQEVFKSDDNISNLFDILLIKKSKYAEYDLTTNEYLSLSSKLNEKIETIFPKVESIDVNMLYLGLDISDNIKLEYEKTNTVIGMPLFDLGGDVGLLIYSKIKTKFTSEVLKNKKLSKFNHLSAICNGKNFLYISGGDATKKSGKAEPTNHFVCIDLLNTNSIKELPKLNLPRSWHSMIYIPKKYIYIAGGGAKETELYDIEKKTIVIDSKMQEIRNECTLFVMNNSILYAFCGISPDGLFISTVERCNLRQKERVWSYVVYSTADNTLFEECFYVANFFTETSLLLLASNEDEQNQFSNILFDLEDEDNPTLNYYESGGKITDVVPEKIFHPIGHNTSIMIPLVGTKAKLYKMDEALKLDIEYFPDALKEIME